MPLCLLQFSPQLPVSVQTDRSVELVQGGSYSQMVTLQLAEIQVGEATVCLWLNLISGPRA